MSLDFSIVWQQFPQILSAFWNTIWIWIVATILAILLGFVVAALRRYGPLWLNLLLRLYVEVIRGTPFLIQLFLLYFGGPFIGLSLEPIPAGLLGMTVYGSAYFSEIFRAGFAAIPPGHIEAAECVGLSRGQIVRRILVPEMTMLVLPQIVNMAIILMKETAILSIITVPELTLVVGAIGSQQYAFVEAMTMLALFYWALVELSGWLGGLAEKKLSKFRFAH
ncbi:amino acid ABC transporter permease [Jiella avicenniae]|uniref:Amino acid ABC transporter permease n=1 Tax=Jiella avicenniae TaxID=2907202 RepID=A0A9X1NXZ9_9HYPH|nr:amino acid ABC transporter permease [Jiella avicenniae]MCE7027587.1 amino acid ABC transporter permease [Jiella avicenniae]